MLLLIYKIIADDIFKRKEFGGMMSEEMPTLKKSLKVLEREKSQLENKKIEVINKD